MPSQAMPEKVGRYSLIREIGRGGMGIVYLAQDPFIDRLVAIKTSLMPPPTDPEEFEAFKRLFFNEARAAGKLTHPNLVPVYDATIENGWFYLVMEYVDGETLREYGLESGLLPIENIVKIMFQCAKTLDYAHQNGVIHRDVKPTNIMINQRGEVKISDFGIAAVEDMAGDKFASSLTGSVFYASPEQLRNESLTPQTDIFSLGVVMYELLAGVKPFTADTDVGTFFKITSEDPMPVRSHRPETPEALARIVTKALEKDLGNRYQSCLQMASELSATFDLLRFVEEEINFEEKLNALKKIQFFKEFSGSELAEVLRKVQFVKYETAATIITEGEIEESFFIIVSGEVLVRKRGQSLAELQAGDCFGEMAYLGRTKRTASIIALGPTILMKINASVIDQTSLGTQLRFYKVFTRTLIQRLTHTSEQLSKFF